MPKRKTDDNLESGSRSSRGLAIVEYVTQAGGGVSAAEITQATGLPRATVHRLVGVLEREGYLQRDFGGRGLVAGQRLSDLARAVLASTPEQLLRHAVLRRLSEDVGETCNITVPAPGGMIYFDRVETEWPLRLETLPVGSQVPLHCTASGKLYLSSLAPAQRDDMVHQLTLDAKTPNTLTDPGALLENLEDIAETGIGADNEEFIGGMIALAAPILDSRGRLCATLAFHAPVQRMTLEQARTHIPALMNGATRLSASKG